MNQLFGDLTPTCGAIAIFAFLSSFFLLASKLYDAGMSSRPPGPKRLPFVGNIFDLFSPPIWKTAYAWKEQFGDVVYLEVFGHPIVFLNSVKASVDLLEKRSSNYSSRPRSKWDWLLFSTPYGRRLRQLKSNIHRYFQTSAVKNYQHALTNDAYAMLAAILNEPGDYGEHVRMFPVAVMMMILYGYRVASKDDPYAKLPEEGMKSLVVFFELYPLVDWLPWSRYLPEKLIRRIYERFAARDKSLSQSALRDAYEMTKLRMRDGTVCESMATDLLRDASDEQDHVHEKDDEAIAASTGSMYLGTDAIGSTLIAFVLAMCQNPQIQRIAQEEIDREVGTDRLPTFADWENLPYVQAICRELFRWEPIVPLGIPHYSHEDDVYRGYHIPAGTTVVVNIWGIFHDPEEYSDPGCFKPERWLQVRDGTIPSPVERVAFGFGRRVCPGKAIAEHAIFIAVASILAAFNIEQAVHSDGKPVPLNAEFPQVFLRRLEPSICKITPRSTKISSLISSSMDALST